MSLDELRRTVLEVFNRIENLAGQRKDEQQKMSEFLSKLDYKKYLESEKKLKTIEAEIRGLVDQYQTRSGEVEGREGGWKESE